MDDHAQKEIRQVACDVFNLIKPIVPLACQAFIDYRINSVTITGPEGQALRTGCTDHLSRGEKVEFEEKRKLLNI